jgi:hypothetical protein
MIGIGIGIQFNNYRGGLSAEALAWKARIEANSGTIPAATLAIFDQYFFIPAKANGNILSELDRLNIYCGLVGYEIAARTNIIKSAHYVTPVSSPTFDNNGYKSSGTSYLDLNYNPSTEGVKLTLNSTTIGVIFKNPNIATNFRSMGCTAASFANRLEAYINFFAAKTISANSGGQTTATTAPTGFLHLLSKRTTNTTQQVVINGTATSGATASNAIPNAKMFELTSNSGGSPIGDYDTNYHYASYCGSGALDEPSLRTILNNLFTALGV